MSKTNFLNFLWQSHKKEIIISLIVIGMFVFFFAYQKLPSVISSYKSIYQPIVSLSTAIAALLIWWSERKKEWRNEYIPKKLTVRYWYGNRLVMECLRSNLMSESDIRPWAQQIGAQMVGVRHLAFEPHLEKKPSGPPIKDEDDNWYKLYELDIKLKKLPVYDKGGAAKEEKENFETHSRKWHWENGELQDKWIPIPQQA